MTQLEFKERTGLTPGEEEFSLIHAIYMETRLDKDEFCQDFKKHGGSKIIDDLHVTAVNYKLKSQQQKEAINETADILLGKAQAYNDTDLYRMAVKLIGQKKVVLRKLEMGLPLWDEDKELITEFLRK